MNKEKKDEIIIKITKDELNDIIGCLDFYIDDWEGVDEYLDEIIQLKEKLVKIERKG